MSIIEQAAQRLETLRRAGIEPTVQASAGAELAGDDLKGERAPTPERMAQVLQTVDSSTVPTPTPAEGAGGARRSTSASAESALSERRSRSVDIDLDALAAAGFLAPDAQRAD